MYTYIIVDDEMLVRKGTIKKLQTLNDQASCIGEAANGKEALQILEEKNPDIIITDMNMPVMDGTQFLSLVTEKFPTKLIIVISGYKDFEYAKHALASNAIDYILKPFSKEDLQKAVLNAIYKLEHQQDIISKLVSSESEKNAARYDYDLQTLKNMILGYNEEATTFTSEELKLLASTHHIRLITLYSKTVLENGEIEDYLVNNGLDDLTILVSHPSNENMHFILFFIPESKVTDTEELMDHYISSLSGLTPTQSEPFIYGISMLQPSIQFIHTAYLQTITALNSQVLGKPQHYLLYNKAQESPNPIQWSGVEEFLFRVESGKIDEVELLIDALFNYFLSLNQCTLYDVKHFCYQLSDDARQIVNTYFDQGSKNVSTSIQSILNTIFTFSEVKAYYLNFFVNIAKMLKNNNIYAIDNTIEKVKRYIERNYAKDLNVEFVASLFYLNRSYLSHQFKQQTGVNFVDYVNTIRINHAKKLMTTSDKKMYQIAKSAGFDNIKYFYRVFKKHEKITPKKYQALHK
jgi:two-component system response regulator YesN